MSGKGLLGALSREQRRSYVSALGHPGQKRVEARHKYVMLKEMPYRDEDGRAMPIIRNNTERGKLFGNLGIHTRRENPHLAKVKTSVSLYRKSSCTALPAKPVRLSPYRRRRESKVEFVIRKCEESSRVSPSPGRTLSLSPGKHRKRRADSVPSLFS